MDYLLTFGISLSLILALTELRHISRLRNQASFSYTIAVGYQLLYFYLFLNGQLAESFPFLFLTLIPVAYLIGPGLFLFYRSLNTPSERFNPKDLWLYGPLLVACLLLIPYFTLPTADKVRYLEYFKNTNHLFPENDFLLFKWDMNIIAGGAGLYILAVILYIIYQSVTRLSRKDLWKSPYFFMTVWMASLVVTFVVMVIVFRGNSLEGMKSIVIVGFATLLYLYVVGHMYNRLSVPETPSTPYAHSKLEHLDTSVLQAKLNDLVFDKIYTDPKLDLKTVAGMLGLNTAQASEFFNRSLNRPFREWLNGIRVEHACDLLVNEPELPVMHIGYQVGFNSKSTFFDAFKSQMKCSPASYRQNKMDS